MNLLPHRNVNSILGCPRGIESCDGIMPMIAAGAARIIHNNCAIPTNNQSPVQCATTSNQITTLDPNANDTWASIHQLSNNLFWRCAIQHRALQATMLQQRSQLTHVRVPTIGLIVTCVVVLSGKPCVLTCDSRCCNGSIVEIPIEHRHASLPT